MGNTNTIPVVSQVKSTIQLVTGDAKGAAETQEKFFHEAIGVSQITAVAYAISGNEKKAEETLERGLTTLSNTADGIPVVGHAKGLVHYAMGDDEKGDRAMMASTRTAAVVGGGAGGFLLGGPVGAVAAGVASGNAFDITHSVATDTPQGYYAAAEEFMKNPSAGALIDVVLVPVGDGIAGYQGGQLAKSIKSAANSSKAADLRAQADAALAKAESMAESAKFNSGQLKAQYDTAQSLFTKSEALSNGGKAPPVFDPKNPTKSGSVPAVLVEKPTTEQKTKEEKTSEATDFSSTTTPSPFFFRPVEVPLATTRTLKTETEFSTKKYSQELYDILEEYEKFDQNDALAAFIQEYKLILRGAGVFVTKTVRPFCKTAYKEEIEAEYDYQKEQVSAVVYGKTVADEFEEDSPLRGFQILLTLQRESFGSLHTLISHPQDMYQLIPDLDLSAYPTPYYAIIKQTETIKEQEKDKLVKQTKANYHNEPEARYRMRMNELRLLAFLRAYMRPEAYVTHQFYMPDGKNKRQRMRVVFNVPDRKGKMVKLCVCLSCDTINPGSAIIYQSPGKDGIEYDCYEIITAFIYDEKYFD